MMNSKPALAIFDLDYTLTRRGTWGRFVWMNVKNRPHLWGPLLLNAAYQQWRYKQGRCPRIDVKAAMMRWGMVGKAKSDLKKLAERFAKREVESGLRPGGVDALAYHKSRGNYIIIASAAVDILVEPIAQCLDVPYYVATDMAWDGDDNLAPYFASPNCYGEQKLSRVKALIASRPELQSVGPVTAYSDSAADIPLFEFADKAVAVDPNKKLQAYADKRDNISITSWL